MSVTNEGPTWLSTGLQLTDWEICRWVIGVQTHECCECYRAEGGADTESFREALHPPRTTVSMLRYETSFVFPACTMVVPPYHGRYMARVHTLEPSRQPLPHTPRPRVHTQEPRPGSHRGRRMRSIVIMGALLAVTTGFHAPAPTRMKSTAASASRHCAHCPPSMLAGRNPRAPNCV